MKTLSAQIGFLIGAISYYSYSTDLAVLEIWGTLNVGYLYRLFQTKILKL